MVAKSTAPVETHQLKEWRDRLENLERLLETAPPGEWEWLWKIRHRIMAFLLARYEQERLVDAGISAEVGSKPVAVETHIEDTKPYSTRREWTAPDVNVDTGKSLRSSEEMRAFLERTRKVNEDRHTDWEKMRTQMLNEMERAIRVQTDYWSNQHYTLDKRNGAKDLEPLIGARILMGVCGVLLIMAMLASAYNLSMANETLALPAIVVVLVIAILMVALSFTAWPKLLMRVPTARLRRGARRSRVVMLMVITILTSIVVLQSCLIAVLLLARAEQTPVSVTQSPVANSPTDSMADRYYLQGVVLRMQGNYEAAAGHFGVTIRQFPSNGELYLKRGDCYMEMAMLCLKADNLDGLQQYFNSASRDFRLAVHYQGTDPDTDYEIASKYMKLGKMLGAAAREDPRGIIKRLRDEVYDEAYLLCGNVIQERTDHVNALFLMAKNEFDRGRYAICRRTCSMVLEFDSKHSDGRFLRARAEWRLGNHEAALADCDRVLADHPDDVQAAMLREAIAEKKPSR